MFVTGTFDDWGKTVRLEPTDHGFEKEVSLPLSEEKILYKVRGCPACGKTGGPGLFGEGYSSDFHS